MDLSVDRHIQYGFQSGSYLGLNVLGRIERATADKTPETTACETSDSLQEVGKRITLLHQFSNTVRQAGRDAQNDRGAGHFKVQDDEGNDAEVTLLELFSNYIRDRFPAAKDIIRSRLAQTMLLRRRRVLYRRSRQCTRTFETAGSRWKETPTAHPETHLSVRSNLPPSTTGSRPQELGSATPKASQHPSRSLVHSVTPTATTLRPEQFRMVSTSSVVSATKTIIVPDGDDFPFPISPCDYLVRRFHKIKRPRTGSGARSMKLHSSIQPSKAPIGLEDYLRRIGEVSCPFCLDILPVEVATNPQKWRYATP